MRTFLRAPFVIGAIPVSLVGYLHWEETVSDRAADEYAAKFLQSAYRGDAFYRQFPTQPWKQNLDDVRQYMTKGYVIDHVDQMGTSYEYALHYKNGVYAVMYVVARNGNVTHVELNISVPKSP